MSKKKGPEIPEYHVVNMTRILTLLVCSESLLCQKEYDRARDLVIKSRAAIKQAIEALPEPRVILAMNRRLKRGQLTVAQKCKTALSDVEL